MSRIRANNIVNGTGTGAPTFPNGAVINGISTITADVTLNTAQLNGTDANFSGIGTYGVVSLGTGTSISSPSSNVLTLGTNNTEVLRITANGDTQVSSGSSLYIANGNLVFSTSGTGIDFSATSDGSGTTTSELLDDYEAGRFTFTLTDDGTGTELTNPATIARYVRIGNVCHIMIHIPTHTQPGTGSVTAGGSAPFVSTEPSVLIASGALRGYDSNTRNLSPCVIIAGATRTEGGSDFYLHTADEFSNISGYDLTGGWTRDSNFNAPGIFISGSYFVN